MRGSFLNLNQSFLENKFQKIILNGQTSERLPLKKDVPQGSVLGPLCSLICITDLSIDLVSS